MRSGTMHITGMTCGRTTRVSGLAWIALLMAAAPLLAQDASVVYLEGEPERRTAQGTTEWLDFGSPLVAGDSVVTGSFDFVELEQGAASTIQVEPDTVFTIREVETARGRQTVMSNSVGSVRYRFNRLAGRDEPQVGTSTVVAGIRGTEVTVYAGADGSSLFLVDSGEVEVTSAGESVSLTAAEGVEVPAGGPPGEKFEYLGRAIDFSEWNQERTERFLADPAGAVSDIRDQLDVYYAEIATLREQYADARARYDEQYAVVEELLEEYDPSSPEVQEARDLLSPLINETTVLAFNIRYYALTSLSLRRFVIGNMYMEMKSRYILDQEATPYQAFLSEYELLLAEFEESVTPELVAVDI